jgi:hypothetical protein
MAGVGDLVQRIEDGQIYVRYSVARQSKGRVMPCAFCTIHKETRFPGLDLKTKSYDLMVLASKSLRQFFDFGLKTKLAMVCPLRHKTDGKRTMRGTCRDLVACFVVKQVGLGFPSLPQNWQMSDDGWCT